MERGWARGDFRDAEEAARRGASEVFLAAQGTCDRVAAAVALGERVVANASAAKTVMATSDLLIIAITLASG